MPARACTGKRRGARARGTAERSIGSAQRSCACAVTCRVEAACRRFDPPESTEPSPRSTRRSSSPHPPPTSVRARAGSPRLGRAAPLASAVLGADNVACGGASATADELRRHVEPRLGSTPTEEAAGWPAARATREHCGPTACHLRAKKRGKKASGDRYRRPVRRYRSPVPADHRPSRRTGDRYRSPGRDKGCEGINRFGVGRKTPELESSHYPRYQTTAYCL